MKAIILLAIVALASAAREAPHVGDPHDMLRLHVAEANRRFGQTNFKPRIPQFNVADFKNYAISAGCLSAAQSLGTKFQSCSAFTVSGPALFDNNRTSEPTQADVAAFCDVACKADFETELKTNFLVKCTALEILEIEIADRQSKGDNGFQFYKLIFILRQPCVKFGSDYCLPTFWRLVHHGEGWQPTVADLEGICTPCLVAFFVEFVKYAPLNQLQGLAWLDLLCTNSRRAGTGAVVWCIIEFKESEAIANTDITGKINRICSTRCYQKILVKTYLAAGALGQTDAQKAQMAAAFKQLDIFCASNGKTYCGVELFDFNQTFNAPGGPVEICTPDFTHQPVPLCGAACADAGKKLYDKLGCCFTTLMQAETEWKKEGETPFLPQVKVFLDNTCKLTAPGGCFKAGKFIAAKIVIRNLVWAYYLANIAAVRAAILADLAVQLGARLNQIAMQGEASQAPATTSADGFTILANEGVTFNVKVDSDGSAGDVDQAAAQFQDSVKNNQVVFTQGGQLPYNSRGDPSLGLFVDTTASTVVAQNSASTRGFSIFAILAAIVAALALRA